jgi:hypothetical protein
MLFTGLIVKYRQLHLVTLRRSTKLLHAAVNICRRSVYFPTPIYPCFVVVVLPSALAPTPGQTTTSTSVIPTPIPPCCRCCACAVVYTVGIIAPAIPSAGPVRQKRKKSALADSVFFVFFLRARSCRQNREAHRSSRTDIHAVDW